MRPKVEWTNQSKLAEALAITDRRVRQLEDQGVLVVAVNGYRYRLFKTRDNDRPSADAEQAAWRAQDALDQIHAALSLKERRRLARKLGPTIGELGEAMRLSNALLEEQHERDFLNMFTQLLVDRAFAELRDLCEWKLPNKPTGSARRSARQQFSFWPGVSHEALLQWHAGSFAGIGVH
jgi:DNA-binding transcriptional MerR regulator